MPQDIGIADLRYIYLRLFIENIFVNVGMLAIVKLYDARSFAY